MSFISKNPYTGELYFEIPFWKKLEAMRAVDNAEKSFIKWRTLDLEDRKDLLRPLRDRLLKRLDTYSALITREMGKPIAESKAEVEKCARLIDFYTHTGWKALEGAYEENNGEVIGVRKDPVGLVLGVMPWNFPFWQVFRFAVPAILAGNVALLKHAPNVPGCARAIEELFSELTDDPLLFSLYIDVPLIEEVLRHPLVRGAALTGSRRAGSAYGALASKHIIPSVLELGSNDPLIILPDADIEHACDTFIDSRFSNSGQTCIAAKRLIVHKSVEKEVLRLVEEKIQKLNVGDPREDNTDISCMARPDLADQLMEQWEKSKREGTVILEPENEDGKVRPGMILNPDFDTPAWQEELFGPIAVMKVANSEEECLELANDTEFGLGAALFTSSREKIEQFLPQLDFGTVVVNQKVASDPEWPFGGFKQSGYGRELGEAGLLEFVNLKTVRIPNL